MKYQLIVQAVVGPCPLGSRENVEAPSVGDVLTEDIEGEACRVEVVAVQHLPVVPNGTFKHDQVYVIGRLL